MTPTRRFAIAAALAVAIVCPACRRQTAPARRTLGTTTVAPAKPQDLRNARIHDVIPFDPVFLDTSAIGDTEGPDGTVRGAQSEYAAGRPIHLMMRFRKSPEALETTVRLLDASKKLVYGDMHAMHGAKSVTFTIPGTVVRPGRHTVQGYWGGNLACEYAIDVEPAK